MKPVYILYVLVMAAIVGTIATTPLLALHGYGDLASLSYNAYVPTCHQWIYRSSCIFYDGNDHWIGDCITGNATISTEFTNAPKTWDGEFYYSRDQIGRNRAEKVEYGNTIGYKFPNDTRNIGLYLSMLITGVVLPFVWKKPFVPPAVFLVLGILPLAIDGSGQFIDLWESTNLIRFATGVIAGIMASIYIYSMLSKD